jgi:threonine synthase
VKEPRLYAAQPLNCSPVDASFQAGAEAPVARPVLKTIAEGTAIKQPLRLREMIRSLRETGGDTVAVPEADIIIAFEKLARMGLLVEPTSATAAAAIDSLAARGAIHPKELTVVILTGAGVKSTHLIEELVAGRPTSLP